MDKISKTLSRITPKEKERIKTIINKLQKDHFSGLDIKKLRGISNIFRVRKGNIRIIYQVRSGQIFILKIGRRKENTYNL